MNTEHVSSHEPTMEEVIVEHQAKLCRMSGAVSDNRRAVTFFYLLLRDHVTFGMVGQIIREVVARVPTDTDHLTKWDQLVLDRTLRIFDAASYKQLDFMRRSLSLVSSAVWGDIEPQLPLEDDVDTTFTNGWLALYAKWLVGELVGAPV